MSSSYPSVLTYVLGAQKNRLIETVLLSIHNVCFGLEIRILKCLFWYALLTKCLCLGERFGKFDKIKNQQRPNGISHCKFFLKLELVRL